MQLLDHATNCKRLTLCERDALDSMIVRLESIAVGDEEIQPGRAFMDITKLMRIVGGEYGQRAARLQ